MSESDVVRRVIARLVEHADDQTTEAIHKAARAAKYLWRCGNADCRTHNLWGQRYCEGCGWGRSGRPVGDITPSLYDVPARKWRALQRAVVAHFEQLDGPMPDAVVFDYFDGPGWRGAEVRTMHGGQCSEVAGGFRDRTVHEDIAAALDGLTRFEKPAFGEHMRLVLSA